MGRRRIEDTAKTEEEKTLSKLGVPRQFWSVKLKDFSFRTTAFRGGKLSAAAQRQWCESLILDPPYAPLIVASSVPTGSGAVALLSWFLRHRLHYKRPKGHINLVLPHEYRVKNYSTLCAYNATNEATPTRCEALRDLMTAYDTNFRAVAVSGSKNPETWSLNKMRLTPTVVFLLKDL